MYWYHYLQQSPFGEQCFELIRKSLPCVECNERKIQLCYTKIKNTIQNPRYKRQHYINKLLLTLHVSTKSSEVVPSEVT